MRAIVADYMSGVARVVVAGVSLGLAFVFALGSGVDETFQVFGVTLTAAQRVLAAAVVFGGALFWENQSLRHKLMDHAASPRMSWSDPRISLSANGAIHLEVLCENSGPYESVGILRGGSAWINVQGQPVALVMPVKLGSVIRSSAIDQQKHRWMVAIDSPPNVQYSVGDWEITWMMVYFDNARPNTHGYLTQEGISVTFSALGGPSPRTWCTRLTA